jgi:hypothetical protein
MKTLAAASLLIPAFAFANTVTTINLQSVVPVNIPNVSSIKNITSIAYSSLSASCNYPNVNTSAQNGLITSGTTISGKMSPIYLCAIPGSGTVGAIKAAQYNTSTKLIQYFAADSTCDTSHLNTALKSISGASATLHVSLVNGQSHCTITA